MLLEETSMKIFLKLNYRVTDVWVNGKYLMKERELTTIDMDEVRQLGEKWNEKLTAFKNEMRK